MCSNGRAGTRGRAATAAGIMFAAACQTLSEGCITHYLNAANISCSCCHVQIWESGHEVQGRDRSAHHVFLSSTSDPIYSTPWASARTFAPLQAAQKANLPSCHLQNRESGHEVQGHDRSAHHASAALYQTRPTTCFLLQHIQKDSQRLNCYDLRQLLSYGEPGERA